MSENCRKSASVSVTGLNTSTLNEGEVTNIKENSSSPDSFHDVSDNVIPPENNRNKVNILDMASQIEEKLNLLITSVEDNDKAVNEKIIKIMGKVSALEKKLT